MVKNLILSFAPLLLFGSCITTEQERKAVVSVDQQTLSLYRSGGVIVKSISTAKKGTGGKPKSNKTPLGTFYVGVKKVGKFGLCVELHGVSEDGYEQKGRYIEVHGSKGIMGAPYSEGCVRCSYDDLAFIMDNLQLGDQITIQ